jgi:hypothetical protein
VYQDFLKDVYVKLLDTVVVLSGKTMDHTVWKRGLGENGRDSPFTRGGLELSFISSGSITQIRVIQVRLSKENQRKMVTGYCQKKQTNTAIR